MNKKLLVGLLAFIVLTVGLWLFLRPHGKTHPANSNAIRSPAQIQVIHTNQFKSAQSYPSKAEQAQTLEQKSERYIRKATEYGLAENRPINFYGQIFDQNNQLVSGVQIKCEFSYFSTEILPGLSPHHKQLELTSDSNGRFSVENQKGLTLDVRLQPKEGYEFKGEGFLSHSFTDIGGKPPPPISTPDKPYIFHAFKKGETDPLIVDGITFYDCKPDGRWYAVDLKQRRVVEFTGTGDFRISVRRPSGWTGQQDYDWSVQIEGVSGDIVETYDEFMYQAPESGYQSSWSYAQQAGEPKYKREVSPKFYFKARDGSMYGHVEMFIKSNSREGSAILINYWLNPFGSRNLEYDEGKKISRELIQRVGLEKAIEQVKNAPKKDPNLTPEQQDLEDLKTNRRSR